MLSSLSLVFRKLLLDLVWRSSMYGNRDDGNLRIGGCDDGQQDGSLQECGQGKCVP